MQASLTARLLPEGTPPPSDAVIGVHDDVGRRVKRETDALYVEGVANILLLGSVGIPTFIFGEVVRELSGAQDLPLLAILGVRLCVGALLLAGWFTLRRNPVVAVARPLELLGLFLVGDVIGWLDGLTYGENPLYFGSVATIAYVHALYVPTGWRFALLAGSTCWAGTVIASLLTTLLGVGIVKPSYWADFTNQQVFVLMNLLFAAAGAYMVDRLRRREIQARAAGRYKVVKRIGAGGFGEVHEAWDNLLERPCAIKMLDARFGEREAVIRRFELEAKATCRLTSPHTVRIYDYGCTRDNRLYYVMERLRGRDLGAILDTEGAQPPERIVPLMRQAAMALLEAHDQGVIHRDIKPENLFVTRDDTGQEHVHVLDFGLAAAISNDGGDAQAKEGVVGTPDYMPTERARGERGDARSDIYSLGAAMFHLLTGRPVFDYPNPMRILMAHLREEPQRPSDLNPAVPDYLDAIVLRCLEKDAERRFADMRALLQALTAAEAELRRDRPAPSWS